MFTEKEKSVIKERFNMAQDRIINTNIRCFKGHKKPVFLISDTYPGVWLEHSYDSLFLAKLDKRYLNIAKNTLCLFLDNQRGNGQLPCYVIDKAKAPNWESPGYSQIQECVSFTRLCYEYYEMSEDLDFLKYSYERCVKWQGWYEKTRMPSNSGLIEMFCGYDTGHDNSCRIDGSKYKYAAKDNDAACYPEDDEILPIIAPDINSVYYGTLTALSDMANRLKLFKDAAKWKEKADFVRTKLFEICYDEKDCFFYDVDKKGKKIKHLSISITNVLSEHVVSQKTAADIINKHLLNPDEFYTEYPFPSIAKSDIGFKRNNNGNSWNYYSQALTLLRCTRWMDFYGYSKEFDKVSEKWVRQWAFSKAIMFGQELEPLTGQPSDCSEWYSSCMLIYVYAVKRLGIVK